MPRLHTQTLYQATTDQARQIPPALLDRVIQTMNPKEVWLFGSRAKGNSRPDSDWDLLVVLPDGVSEKDLDLYEAYQKVIDLLLPVDLFPVRHREFQKFSARPGSLEFEVKEYGYKVYDQTKLE